MNDFAKKFPLLSENRVENAAEDESALVSHSQKCTLDQGCQIFLHTIYQYWGKYVYQFAAKLPNAP
jgi:hypothetical protein